MSQTNVRLASQINAKHVRVVKIRVLANHLNVNHAKFVRKIAHVSLAKIYVPQIVAMVVLLVSLQER